MLQRDPSLSPSTVKARLMLSADKWDFRNGTTDPCTFGSGYLNIPAALANTSITRTFARLRHEVGGLVDDSYRTRPFYASSKEKAVAKRDAAIEVLNELADRIDRLKKEGN